VRRDPGEPAFDPDKPRGWAGGALTPEYKAVFEPNLRDLAAGGEGLGPGYKSVHVLYLKNRGVAPSSLEHVERQVVSTIEVI
jgi:hypothetical protein